MSTPLPVLTAGAGAGDEQRRRKIAADLTWLEVGDVRFGRHDRLLYSTDASLYQVEPIGVVIPQDIDQVARLLTYCHRHGLPVLPRGGGTSLAGQCTNHAVVVDLSVACRRILSVDPATKTCRVEPGVLVDQINRALASVGMFVAFDPASSAQATIGGCIGNNAAGARSIVYGRTSENVSGLEVVLADGRRTRLGPGAGSEENTARELAEQTAQIVREFAGPIRQRLPKLIRRNSGYNLDLILDQLDRGVAPAELDLSGLICGSEGTLAVVVAAKLKLHPLPKSRGLAIVSFDSLEAAVGAVQTILATGPSAVELLDDVVLSAAQGNAECQGYLRVLPTIGGVGGKLPTAVLYVEYQAMEDPRELDESFARLRGVVGDVPIATYVDSPAVLQAWALRRAGEPLLHGLPGRRKPITFVEDNSVPVEQLPRFVAEFKKIVAAHGTSAAYYAHASVGVLHVRPMLDLHEESDRQRMRQIAAEVADAARACGGVVSGEHGDGRVRGPLLERILGPEILAAFARVKSLFDPANLLNPHMIVDAGPIESLTQNLRVEAAHPPAPPAPPFPPIQTFFDYSDQDDFPSAVERCNGAGFCRKMAGGTMCPSYRATLDERHSTRGRGNALRQAILGAAPDWTDPDTRQTLDLCLSCKACKTECPSNVDIARLKAEYLAQCYRQTGVPLSARLLGHVRALNRLGSIAPDLFNWLTRRRLVRLGLDRILDLAPRRNLPPFGASLYRWHRRRPRQGGEAGGARVVLFADCFTAYSEPAIGQAAVGVLEALGYAVDLPSVGCCGRAMISTGLLQTARPTIDATVRQLAAAADGAKAILVCEPSCLSAIKDEWLSLKLDTPIELRRELAAKSMLPEQFIERFWEEHPHPPRLSPTGLAEDVIFHGHCHQKALWGEQTSTDLLKRLCGSHLKALDTGCCGMAGAFGYTADHYDVSMAIGELSLLGSVRKATAGTLIVAPGTSCRHQIRDATGRSALHPIELAERLIAAGSGSSARI